MTIHAELFVEVLCMYEDETPAEKELKKSMGVGVSGAVKQFKNNQKTTCILFILFIT